MLSILFSSAQRFFTLTCTIRHDQATKKDATKKEETKEDATKKDAYKYAIKNDAMKEDARHQSILQSANKSVGRHLFQDRHQFYSYIPTESPTSRFFPVRGMQLDVSLILSKPVHNIPISGIKIKD